MTNWSISCTVPIKDQVLAAQKASYLLLVQHFLHGLREVLAVVNPLVQLLLPSINAQAIGHVVVQLLQLVGLPVDVLLQQIRAVDRVPEFYRRIFLL